FGPDLPARPAELLGLLQRTDAQGVAARVLDRARIDRRAAGLAKRMNALGAAVRGLDVWARRSLKEAEACGRSGDARAKRRTREPLAIQAVADGDGVELDL